MNTEKMGRWLQIGANIGILAGLVLVGIQMQQNSDLLRTELIYSESGRQLSFEHAMLGEDPAAVWAKAMTNPTEMSLREQRISEAIMYQAIEQWMASYRLYEMGLLEVDQWKYRINIDATYMFGNPYGAAYWDTIRVIAPDELAEHIDSVIGTEGMNATEYLNIIMDKTKKNIESLQ